MEDKNTKYQDVMLHSVSLLKSLYNILIIQTNIKGNFVFLAFLRVLKSWSVGWIEYAFGLCVGKNLFEGCAELSGAYRSILTSVNHDCFQCDWTL